MSIIKIAATERSPELVFDFEHNRFHLKGESYPEDVMEFYGKALKSLEVHLSGLSGSSLDFVFELIYFNSSSAKILMSLFDMLEETADAGNKVNISWVYQVDDDNMEELGEEFGEDLLSAKFTMKPVG